MIESMILLVFVMMTTAMVMAPFALFGMLIQWAINPIEDDNGE